MRGSAWHYAIHLLAPRSFHSAAGCNGGRPGAEGRSRGQVLAVICDQTSQSSESWVSHFTPQPGLLAPLCIRGGLSIIAVFHLPSPWPRHE